MYIQQATLWYWMMKFKSKNHFVEWMIILKSYMRGHTAVRFLHSSWHFWHKQRMQLSIEWISIQFATLCFNLMVWLKWHTQANKQIPVRSRFGRGRDSKVEKKEANKSVIKAIYFALKNRRIFCYTSVEE